MAEQDFRKYLDSVRAEMLGAVSASEKRILDEIDRLSRRLYGAGDDGTSGDINLMYQRIGAVEQFKNQWGGVAVAAFLLGAISTTILAVYTVVKHG